VIGVEKKSLTLTPPLKTSGDIGIRTKSETEIGITMARRVASDEAYRPVLGN